MKKPISNPNPREEAKRIALELLDKLSKYEDLNSQDLWQLYKDDAPKDKFQNERALLNEMVNVILKSNPKMISPQLIISRILYMVIGVIIDNPEYEPEFLSKLDEYLNDLLIYKATRPIDVPIVNLNLEGKPFQLGEVNFLPIVDDDRKGMWWESIKGALDHETAFHCVASYGKVLASGDLDTSTLYAGPIVDDAILLLRGISFPFTVDEIAQIGVVGDVSVNRTRFYRLGEPTESVKLEAHSQWVARLGPPLGPYRLYADLLSRVDEADLQNLLHLIEAEGFYPETPMSAKIMRGFRWMGQASKPDTVSARFAKLTFALENLIGGEPQDEKLSSIGLTAMLAERSAFLVSENPEDRKKVDADVRRFYGKRSDIVHGRLVDIGDEDLKGFAYLVRCVAWSLLRRRDQIKTIDDLQTWVKEQRYL
jgi:hypothetical protein